MDGKLKTWPLRFPTRENPNMEKALFDWPIVLQYDVKAKYWLVSRKFSGMKFFQPSVRLTNQKPLAFVSVRKPIKSLYFRSFVVSVLLASFHFKVIRKSLFALLMYRRHFLSWKKLCNRNISHSHTVWELFLTWEPSSVVCLYRSMASSFPMISAMVAFKIKYHKSITKLRNRTTKVTESLQHSELLH